MPQLHSTPESERMKIILTTEEELSAIVSRTIEKYVSIVKPTEQPTDRWFSIDELCEYLPGKPAKATIYGKVHLREIPHKKFGKRLAFLKSEIDSWLNSKGRKTASEIEAEAGKYLGKRKGGAAC